MTDAKRIDERPRTEDVTDTELESFEELHLKRELLKGIHEAGFYQPTPVQEKAIPKALVGENLIVRAKNGTGKTGAFLIPILNEIDTSIRTVQAVIILPSRELALQTAGVAKVLGAHIEGLQVVSCLGGTRVQDDILRFNRPVHLVVGTLGRLNDLLRRHIINSDKLRFLVLDEADKLMDFKFQRNLEEAMSFFPPERQTFLFSATFPQTVESFIRKHVEEPTMINLMEELTLKGVTQYYVHVEEKSKVKVLNALFKRLQINQSIIFCNSAKRVALLAKKIVALGFSCYYIHSGMEQSDRNKIFEQFREGKVRHLICTDLFTRGIDVATVNVVINFDFPSSPETYLHRIGRSGRGGHLGLAINIVTEDDKVAFSRIEKALQTTIDICPPRIDKALYVTGLAGDQ